MFNPPGPHVFALPPGADFPALVVRGLRERMHATPPQAMARVTLYLNTARMQRRISDLMTDQGAHFLPRLRLVSDIAQDYPLIDASPQITPLRRRLELTRLISALLDADPSLAPRSALFDLADSLANLMDEMQGEDVSPAAIAALDVSGLSEHWTRTQTFMGIIHRLFADAGNPDAQSHQRRVVMALADIWATTPPSDPIIIAGSTGSRGTTALFMETVARLPQGALILPGYDFDLPQNVWNRMDDALTAEDHPQYRMRRLMDRLLLQPADIHPWTAASPPNPARARLVSLSLRPAPVTDQWLTEGQHLTDIAAATADMTLIQAQSARNEALAIALILRQAADQGRIVALVSPDRNLTRQVTATLDRWGILPDDSAGRPLPLSAPGRLLRHTARLIGARLTSVALLTVLKHPLTATGWDRGLHLKFTRDLELHLRRHGPPFPDAVSLTTWAAAQKDPGAPIWAAWICATILPATTQQTRPLADHLRDHVALTEQLCAGPDQPTDTAQSGELWLKEAGKVALAAVAALRADAAHGGNLSPYDYVALFDSVLGNADVREDVTPHPRIMIWGTLEARVQGADLVILGGLNDGIWPQMPPPDPWLNRQMRKTAGLLLPERRIGLSAHDYQQAITAPEVILTRAVRNDESETVASRWLNRLTNLLNGLPDQGGTAALAAMKARGDHWLALAARLEAVTPVDPAPRPAPIPPPHARPRELPVTAIKTLIRNPYEIYAKYVLRLRPLDPLHKDPDPRLRGTILHSIIETFIRNRPADEPRYLARARLMATATAILHDDVPWADARLLWLARIDRAADFFLRHESDHPGIPVLIEERGKMPLAPLPFTLTAKPDRIDQMPDGRLRILDYKTGKVPTQPEIKAFDKQLLLEAVMAENGAFRDLPLAEVAEMCLIGVGTDAKVLQISREPGDLGKALESLHRLITRYVIEGRGFTARRALFDTKTVSDYDHLSRFGEWQMTDTAKPVTLA